MYDCNLFTNDIETKKTNYLIALLSISIYIGNYFFYSYIWVLIITFLLVYYYQIINKKYEVYLFGIIICRTMNGFLIINNDVAYDIINILICYLPLLIFCFQSFRRRAFISLDFLLRYKFTLIIIVYYSFLSIINIEYSSYVIKARVLPLIFFAISILYIQPEINFKRLQSYIRCMLIASLILYLFIDYADRTAFLYSDLNVLKLPIEQALVNFLDLSKNFGTVYDARIWGIICYLYILIAIKNKYTNNYSVFYFDIILALAVSITTLSRGGIIVACMITISYFINKITISKLIIFVLLTSMGLILIYFSTENIDKFIDTFNLKNSANAIEQRSMFLDYAYSQFKEHPIFGLGLGYLKSGNINSLDVGNGNISDAFWFIISAETGIVGLILLILFYLEVIIKKNIVVICFTIGFFIQLYGTDVPDMGIFYFYFLIIVHLLFKNINFTRKNNYELRLKPA